MTAWKFTKTDTTMRTAIPAHERLTYTLRFLTTGDSDHSLSAQMHFDEIKHHEAE